MKEREIGSYRKTHKKRFFLKGPIPLDILQKVSALPGRCLHLYLAIRHRSDLLRDSFITLPSDYLASWGIGKDVKSRALRVLEKEGLAKVTRELGKSIRVSID